MQGVPFLGPAAETERAYIFASRDRYDTSYDMIRACRDRRYKYLRHYTLNQERLIWVPYRNEHPIVRELYDGYRKQTLTTEQLALFESRPSEELYDTVTDPFEMNNLAGNPDYAEDLERHRSAVDAWRDQVGDMGEVDESQMVHRATTTIAIAFAIGGPSPPMTRFARRESRSMRQNDRRSGTARRDSHFPISRVV